MKYEIISSGTITALVRNINAHLEDGWVLYGSPFNSQRGQYACQAMTKEDLVVATAMPKNTRNNTREDIAKYPCVTCHHFIPSNNICGRDDQGNHVEPISSCLEHTGRSHD